MKIDKKAIGKRIRDKRNAGQITQEQLADMTNTTSQHISNIENGKKGFSLDLITDITDTLHVTLDEIVKGTASDVELDLKEQIDALLSSYNSAQLRLILHLLISSDTYFRNMTEEEKKHLLHEKTSKK